MEVKWNESGKTDPLELELERDPRVSDVHCSVAKVTDREEQ